MPGLSKTLTGGRRHFAIGAVLVVGVGALYLIAAGVNHLAPFGSAASSPSSTATHSPGSTSTQGPRATAPAQGSLSLAELVPEQGCSPPPANVTKGLAGLTNALQCTNDPDLPSVVVDGFQFDNVANYQAGLALFNRNIGFGQAGSTCPPSGSGAGSIPWQSSDFPPQPGQVLQCLLIGGDAAYIWTIPGHLAFIEAVDTNAQDLYSGLQNWFVKYAQP